MTAPRSQLPVPPSEAVQFGSKSERRAAVDALRLRLAAMAARTNGPTGAGGPVAAGDLTGDPTGAGGPVAAGDLTEDLMPADDLPVGQVAADLSAGPDEATADLPAGVAVTDLVVGRARRTADVRPGPTTASTARGGERHRGSTRNRVGGREPRGHPEDELGDPETVAKNICLRLLTDSARPRANIFAALMKRGIAEDVADKVLDRFAELGLIDDDAYAQAYVRTKHKERGLGRRALALELRRKGIVDSIAIEAVQEISTDDEWDRGHLLISKRLKSAMAAGPDAARRRLVGLLARRGYSASMSYDLVDSALRDYGVSDVDLPDVDGTL